MSRIGKMPITIPSGVTVELAENNHMKVKGPKGELERTLPPEVEIKVRPNCRFNLGKFVDEMNRKGYPGRQTLKAMGISTMR